MKSKDILILIKTYPEISRKYTETVCSAGVLADTRKLVRLYPIRYRYLTGKDKFSKYQWIKSRLRKSQSDTRPESYKLVGDSITLGEKIGTSRSWQERKKWILNNQTLFRSLEELHQAQESNNMSLGLVKPKKVIRFFVEKKSKQEIKEAEAKKDSIINQLHMFEKKKDLEILPVRFILEFMCDDIDCSTHKLSILDWEFGQLYRRIKNTPDWEEKMHNKVMEICSDKRDTYLILGNMARWQHVFCILGFFYPPKVRQLSLF